MASNASRSFADSARAAFPAAYRALAEQAVAELGPHVDDGYRSRSEDMEVHGQTARLPSRLHFPDLPVTAIANLSAPALCLASRATDGHLRQGAVTRLLAVETPWAAPYVAILLGEYVVEIAEVIERALPGLDRALYANLVRENRATFRTLRARAISYWDIYYRHLYPDRRDYPGLKALYELETWAA